MHNKKSFLAIIPARGGSKRLPRKNVLDLAGKPLIAWTIGAALDSKYIDQVIVTSDDDEILEISKNNGADVLKRPDELSSDTATTFDVIEHAIKQVKTKYDFVILLQPTSPLREKKHIDEAVEVLQQKSSDAVISVCEVDHSPLWSNTIPESGSLENFLSDEIKNKRGQELPQYYRLNGAIYICACTRLLEEKTFFLSSKTTSYEMERKNSIDIDNEIDLKLVEVLI